MGPVAICIEQTVVLMSDSADVN